MRAALVLLLLGTLCIGCGGSGGSGFGSTGSGVMSSADAEAAYKSLDPSIDRAIDLGFQGFNAASSANIPAETGKGMSGGTMTIDGQVDQGASTNKTMNLTETLTAYSDDGKITFDSSGSPAALGLQLKKIPDGTYGGTLSGTYVMSGAETGAVTLALTISGALEPGTGGAKVQRVPGSTHVTGTATSAAGTFNVDVTR